MSDENYTSDPSWKITYSGTGSPPHSSGTSTYPPNWIPQQTLDYTSESDSVRNYKCPKCGGEFNHWDTSINGDQICPFCGLKRHKYDYS